MEEKAWGPVHDDHFVHFYKDDRSLCANVSRFIGEGLRAGEAAVVIMTAEHLESVRRELAVQGTDSGAPLFLSLDARETLSKFTHPDGNPAWPRFESTIGPVLEERARSTAAGRVRAYGEMVDLLWQDGRLAAAMRLEAHWNRLLAGRRIPLYCAYKADLLGEGENPVIEQALSVHAYLRDGDRLLAAAVEASIDEVLGQGKARALRPLIEANVPKGARMPFAEAAVFWIKRNLGEDAAKILSLSRLRLERAV